MYWLNSVLCCNPHRFVRAPPDYYAKPYEYRMNILNAASIHHLCKSMIMVNTRAHPDVQGWEDPDNSKYYVVIVQVGGGVLPGGWNLGFRQLGDGQA